MHGYKWPINCTRTRTYKQAPVYEEDVLTFHHTVLGERAAGSGRLRAIRVQVDAERLSLSLYSCPCCF